MGGNVMMAYARFRLLVLLIVVGALWYVPHAHAQTYNRFGPANGVLKGSTTTPQTTAAVSADIRALWTGTCSAATYMRGDGACATPAGTGVTSVGLTMPSGLTVTGSPITSSGTLAVTTLLNGIVKGNGSGFTTAASTDVTGLWTGTCDATTFLRGDGSCAVAGGGTSGANPTGTIGLTAVNGVSTNFIRSDGAPALSQAIVPTWSGVHTFTANPIVSIAGTADFQVKTTSAGSVAQVRARGASTSQGGICTSDTAAQCTAGAAANDTVIFGTGTIRLASAAGSDYATLTSSTFSVNGVVATPDSYSGTGTIVGCTTSPTVSISVKAFGRLVIGEIASGGSTTCTSNSTSFNITTSIPAALLPSSSNFSVCGDTNVLDNGTSAGAWATIASGGTIGFSKVTTDVFTSSGTKQIVRGFYCQWLR
jgi:hypothetical protein